MPDGKKTLIMKFGGGILCRPDDFHKVAKLVFEKMQQAHVVVVVSAMKGMTDQLIDLAHQVNPHPPSREYDMLVSVGERVSIALLAMALSAQGAQAISFTGSQSGVMTSNEHTEAKIISIQPLRIQQALNDNQAVIVAGFQGVSEKKEITTLGRGGSDTTAVALAIALRASGVEFYKDVGGIYPEDPKLNPDHLIMPYLNYSQALEVILASGGQVIHPRALRLAAANHIRLSIRSVEHPECEGTVISDTTHFSQSKAIYETV
jgi:aspartate kinase